VEADPHPPSLEEYADALKVAIAHEKAKAASLMGLADKSRLGAKLMFTELATEALLYVNSLIIEFEHVLESDELPEGEDSDEFYVAPAPTTESFVIPDEFTLPEQAILVAIEASRTSQSFYEGRSAAVPDAKSRQFFDQCALRMRRRVADLREEYDRNVLTNN
jgi:hypothetical protein